METTAIHRAMAVGKVFPWFRGTLNGFGGRTNGRKCRLRQGIRLGLTKQPLAAFGVDGERRDGLAQVKGRQFELHHLAVRSSRRTGLCCRQTLGQYTVTITIQFGLVLVATQHLFVIAQIRLVMTPHGQLAQYRHEQSGNEKAYQEGAHHATNIRLNSNKRLFDGALLVNVLKSKGTRKTLRHCCRFGTGL